MTDSIKKAENPRRQKDASSQGKAPVVLSAEENDYLKQVGSTLSPFEFYRDRYRLFLKISVIEVFIILFLCFVVFFVIEVQQPKDSYFVTTADGRLIPMTDLSDPNLTHSGLMAWSAIAVTDALTFSYNDYQEHIQRALEKNFMIEGRNGFSDSLERLGIVETIQANHETVKATLSAAPIVVSEGIVRDCYQWVLQVPVRLAYDSSSSSREELIVVDMVVARVARLESMSGVAVREWNVRSASLQ